MAWWIWCVLGLILLAGEMFTPGSFILFFFGLAAILVSLFSSLSLLSAQSTQWLFFSIFSIGSLVIFRERLRKGMLGGDPKTDVDGIVGGIATAAEDLSPGGSGQVEHRGTSWGAVNSSHETILKGQECRIVQMNGLKLTVRKV